MLFNRKKISELEAEVRSLRQALRDADTLIKDQKMKIDELNDCLLRRTGKSNQNHKTSTQANSAATFGSVVSLDDIAQLLYDFVCEDKKSRLDQYVNPKTIFDIRVKHKERPDLNVVLLNIISGSGAKGALISEWKRKQNNSELKPRFVEFLPTFFTLLSKHWWIASQSADKNDLWNYARLKYNVNAYALLYHEIIPQIVIDAKNLKKEKEHKKREGEVECKLKEEERKRNEEDRKRKLEADWPLYLKQLESALDQHSVALMRNMRAAYQKNDYGAVVKDEREVEVERFLQSVKLTRRANKHGLKKTVQHINSWYAKQKRVFEQSDAVPEDGHDFEHWVAAKFKEASWKASVTQASGDDGVDVIAKRGGISVAVQCKRFKGSVGNKAVQEVYSGMKHMQLDRAVVISTGQYTKAAQNLARTTGVLLLSEHDIQYLWGMLHT